MEDFLEDVYAQNQNTENFWGGGGHKFIATFVYPVDTQYGGEYAYDM